MSIMLLIILLALCHVILFFGHNLGVNVLLFMIPLVLCIYKIAKDAKKVKNWYGFLFGIPIVILSLYYLIFNNNTFNVLNYITILILLLMMYYSTSRDKYYIKEFFTESFKFIYKPFYYISSFYKDLISYIKPTFKRNENRRKIWKTLLVVIPVVLFILLLLSKADETFASLFNVIIECIEKILTFEFINKLLGKAFMFIVMCFVIGTTFMYLAKDFGKDKIEVKTKKYKDIFTIKVLVVALNVIYIIFDIIQIQKIVHLDAFVNYSSFARFGFFELMVVTFINMFIILLSKRFEVNEKDDRFMKIMNVIMIALTLVIIASTFLRMHLYELAYGYTTLRLFVDVILITEALLMIPTVMYIINDKFNVAKSYLIIVICIYTIVSFINVDGIIATKNINRYYEGKDLDVVYLKTYTTDNIEPLLNLYNNTTDEKIKYDLETYFNMVYSFNQINSWEEFNISKHRAIKLLEENNIR